MYNNRNHKQFQDKVNNSRNAYLLMRFEKNFPGFVFECKEVSVEEGR